MAIGKISRSSGWREVGHGLAATVAVAGTILQAARPFDLHRPDWTTTARRARALFGRRPDDPSGKPDNDPLLDAITEDHIHKIVERGQWTLRLAVGYSQALHLRRQEIPFMISGDTRSTRVMVPATAYSRWVALMAPNDLISFRSRAILSVFAVGRIRPKDLKDVCRLLDRHVASKQRGRKIEFPSGKGDFESRVAELYHGARDYLLPRKDLILHDRDENDVDLAIAHLRLVPAAELHEGLVRFGRALDNWLAKEMAALCQKTAQTGGPGGRALSGADFAASDFFASDQIALPVRMTAAEILAALSKSDDFATGHRVLHLLVDMKTVAAGLKAGTAGYMRSIHFGQELLALAAELGLSQGSQLGELLPGWCRPGAGIETINAEHYGFVGTSLDLIEQSHGNQNGYGTVDSYGIHEMLAQVRQQAGIGKGLTERRKAGRRQPLELGQPLLAHGLFNDAAFEQFINAGFFGG